MFKKYKNFLIAFFLPIIIFFFIFFIRCFIRKYNLFISDSYGQYVSLFSYFNDFLHNKQSIIYSFSKGLGGPMIGTYAYYLASPWNLLLIFFNKGNLDIFFLINILIKIGLSSLTMYIYMNSKKIDNNMLKLAICICYSLMAYIVNYYFHVMWLDGVYLAPLIILGIENIVNKKNSKLYLITLFLSIWCNFYIGYMLCIFSCLYFLYYLFLNYNQKDRKYFLNIIIKFIVSSVLAGLMSFIILCPTLHELLLLNRSDLKSYQLNFDFIKLISNSYIGTQNYDNILNKNNVNLYFGMLPLSLLMMYFCNKNINLKEKLLSFIFIMIFFLSFSIAILNKIWHGFTATISFNYRYSFLFCLFLFIIVIRQIKVKSNIHKEKFLLLMIFYIICSLIVVLNKYNYINYITIFISIGLFIVYTIILLSLDKINKKQKKLYLLLILLLTSGELFLNIYITFRDYKFVYASDYNHLANRKILKNSNKFSRSEFTYIDTSNDSLFFNYNGVTSFLSTNSNNTINFGRNIGFSNAKNIILYKSTLLTDSLLGINTIYSCDNYDDIYMSKGKYNHSKYIGFFYSLGKEKCNIYDNANNLSIGYMISNNVKSKITKLNINNTVFDNQNKLLNSMNDTNYYFYKPIEIVPIKANEYKYYLKDEKYLYLYINFVGLSEDYKIQLYINDKIYETILGNNNGIIRINNKWKNENINIKFEVEGDLLINGPPILYSEDNKLIESQIEKLSKYQLNITSFKDTNIKGNIVVPHDKTILFTSIPYDKGWKVYIDGNKEKSIKLYDEFLGVKLKEGKHKVEFKYYPPGLNIGIIISSISLVLTVLFFKYEKKLFKFSKDA